MKTVRDMLMLLTVGVCISGVALAGEDPSTNPTMFKIELNNVALNPQTFGIVLSVYLPSNRTCNVQAYEGANPGAGAAWFTIAGHQVSDGHLFTVVDAVGPLTTNGRTYRAIVPGPPDIATVNEVFVGYPFLQTPVVSLAPSGMSSNLLTVSYGEGIYANAASCRIPSNAVTGFFRAYSPDNLPTNAVIQYRMNLIDGVWSNAPVE